MCCSCIPYPCRTTFAVKRFLLLCQIRILISDIRIYSFHLLLLSFLDSVFLSLAYFLLLFFWYFLSFSLYFSMLFILRSFLLAKVFPDCHCNILFEFDQRHSCLHTFHVYYIILLFLLLFLTLSCFFKGSLLISNKTYKTSRVLCHNGLCSVLGSAVYVRLHSFAYFFSCATYVGFIKTNIGDLVNLTILIPIFIPLYTRYDLFFLSWTYAKLSAEVVQ